MNKTALICGISGQDGTFLADLLLKKGYNVKGTSRDVQGTNFSNLERIKIKDKITLISMMPEDFRSVLVAFQKAKADEIYFLAGQTSVGLSFELPAETIQSITIGTLNVLEASKMLEKKPKIYFAGSSEIFGDTKEGPANERSIINPKSPYAVAKASAYWLVNNYREAYDLFVCTGILFNHESFLRPERFVTKKIISSVIRISEGTQDQLELGRLDIARDWGWSPEYVEAMWLMLQQNHPDDFVIATGQKNTLQEFVAEAFNHFNLDWKKYVVQNQSFIRPTDIQVSYGDARKARENLSWSAKKNMVDVIKHMIEAERDFFGK